MKLKKKNYYYPHQQEELCKEVIGGGNDIDTVHTLCKEMIVGFDTTLLDILRAGPMPDPGPYRGK